MSGPLAEQDLLQRITPHARVQLNTRATPSGAACAIVARPRAILWQATAGSCLHCKVWLLARAPQRRPRAFCTRAPPHSHRAVWLLTSTNDMTCVPRTASMKAAFLFPPKHEKHYPGPHEQHERIGASRIRDTHVRDVARRSKAAKQQAGACAHGHWLLDTVVFLPHRPG